MRRRADTRGIEAVGMALNGKKLSEIGTKLRVSRERVRQLISRTAGEDFYEQIRLELRRAKWAHYEFDSPAEAERKRAVKEINEEKDPKKRQLLKYMHHPLLYGRRPE